MAGRKVAHRRRVQNRFSMFLVSFVVLMTIIVVSIRMISLKQKEAELDARIAYLAERIQNEEAKAEEIAEYEKYTKTEKFKKEKAREHFGLVDEDEILLIESDN